MPGYGTIATARNLLATHGASNIGTAFTATPEDLSRFLSDPCPPLSDDEYYPDLEHGITTSPRRPPPARLETALTTTLTATRDILTLTCTLIALPFAHLATVSVPVTIGWCLGYSAWSILRVMVPVGLLLNALFCGILCARLWDAEDEGRDVGEVVREAIVLFGRTVACALVMGGAVVGMVVFGRGWGEERVVVM